VKIEVEDKIMSKTAGNNSKTLPKFDPVPSAKFACEVLNELKIDGILIGRLAVWMYLPDTSEHAYTKDFDVAVSKKNRLEIAKYLTNRGYEVRELTIGGFNARISEKDVNVDFIDRYSEEVGNLSDLFGDAISQANETVRIEDTELKIVSVEHLIAMKLATTEKKDEDDAKRLLKEDRTDIGRLRKITRQFLGNFGIVSLERVLLEIGHKEARQRKKYGDS